MADTAAPAVAHRVKIGPYDIEAGPLGHLQAERERLAALEWEHFDARPLGATIGAEIAGVDLAGDLPDDVIAEIRQALLDYKVIFFRDQHLTAAQHVGLRPPLRRPRGAPVPAQDNDELPELVRFEKSPEVGGYENGWHSDVTWRAEPSMGAILRAVEVPPSGGDTLFCDMYAAYEGLDDATRAQIDPLVAIHDYSQVFGHGDPARQEGRDARAVPAGGAPGGAHPPGDRAAAHVRQPLLRAAHRRALARRRAPRSSIGSAAGPRSSSTSAASAGSRARSPSGTTAPSSTTPAATTGPPAGSWSGPRSSATDRSEPLTSRAGQPAG